MLYTQPFLDVESLTQSRYTCEPELTTDSLGHHFTSMPNTQVLFSASDTRMQNFAQFVHEFDYDRSVACFPLVRTAGSSVELAGRIPASAAGHLLRSRGQLGGRASVLQIAYNVKANSRQTKREAALSNTNRRGVVPSG